MNKTNKMISGIGLVLLAALMLLLAGCTQTANPLGNTPAPGAAAVGTPSGGTSPGTPEVNIQISNFKFDPGTVTIKAGTKVTWTQEDSVAHTIVSDTGLFTSPGLSKGDTYSFTFTTPGTYAYHCSIHPGMTGTIIVN